MTSEPDRIPDRFIANGRCSKCSWSLDAIGPKPMVAAEIVSQHLVVHLAEVHGAKVRQPKARRRSGR